MGKALAPLEMSFEKKDAVKTGRFLLFFILVYLVLSFLSKALFPPKVMETWIASNVLGMLSILGQPGSVAIGETATINLASGTAIEISELCTGAMETLVIASAIISSIGISWRKRAFGAVASALIVVALNHFRIIVTTLLILSTQDVEIVEFAHNTLFRLFLFISIAGLYVAWFYWAAGTEAKKARPNRH